MIPGADVYTDFQGFNALRKEAREESPEAIKKVAKQFEALFVQMMLKSMRDAMPEDGLFNSQQQRMYQDMFDKQLSVNISSGRGVGLAAVIERQLNPSQNTTLPRSDISDYLRNPVFSHQPVAQLSAIQHPYNEASLDLEKQGLWEQPRSLC